MADRLAVLRHLLVILEDSIAEAPADKRAALAAQIRGTAADIESLEPAKPADEGTGLSEFQRRLAERESVSSPAHKATR